MTSPLASLDARFETLDYEEHGSCSLTAVELGRGGIHLLLEVRTGADQLDSETWRLTADDVLAHRVTLGWDAEPALHNRHRLLSPVVEDIAELTFYGHPPRPDLVLSDLLLVHHRWSDGWLAFDAFARATSGLLSDGFGQLAVGPSPLMHAYAESLTHHDLKPSCVPVAGAMTPAGESCPRPSFEPVLLTLGGAAYSRRCSYVVGSKVSATRLK